MQTIAYPTAIEVYNKIKSKPKTYTQLKNELKISNSTLSLCLQKLKNEELIEKIIVKDEPHYTIIKNNFIERLNEIINDEEKIINRDIDLTENFTWLSSVADLDPEKYGIRHQYFKNNINRDAMLSILEKNPPKLRIYSTQFPVIKSEEKLISTNSILNKINKPTKKHHKIKTRTSTST